MYIRLNDKAESVQNNKFYHSGSYKVSDVITT
jgi:hypothetical protein